MENSWHIHLIRSRRRSVGIRIEDSGEITVRAPLRMPEGCQIELMADKPLHLAGLLNGLPKLSWLLAFTDETKEERLKITAHYAALLRGEMPPVLDIRGTAGRFVEGVL